MCAVVKHTMVKFHAVNSALEFELTWGPDLDTQLVVCVYGGGTMVSKKALCCWCSNGLC